MYKCHFCKVCNGLGCKGELPGMGGVSDGAGFIENCKGWDGLFSRLSQSEKSRVVNVLVEKDNIAIAPVTGAVENIGFAKEGEFYPLYIGGAFKAGVDVCVGDGCPDEKLILGIKAVEAANCEYQAAEEGGTVKSDFPNKKAHYFFKPYPNDVIFRRVDWAKDTAKTIGVDIDAYNIVTMRNKVHLEEKTASQLDKLRRYSKLPLAIKGVFTSKSVDLCKALLPEIIVVSNHGGRVPTEAGSSAFFLDAYAKILKDCCKELWVDGGIRKRRDIQMASFLGATKVLVGRPFVSAVCLQKENGIAMEVATLLKGGV